MARWLLIPIWLLFLASLSWNLWFWGGLSHLPRLGPALIAAVDKQFTLTATYVGLGQPLLTRLDRARSAAEYSREQLLRSPESLLEGPEGLLVDRLIAALPASHHWSHYAAPWLLVFGLVLTWLKPKPLKITTRR